MTQRQQAPVSSDDALFRSLDDGRFVATQWARGPWNPAHCHGAPPSALLTRMIESIDDGEWQLARITIELQRPVPVAEPLTASREIERPGSTISIASSSLNVGGVTVARARALRMRVFDGQSPNVPHQIQPMPADAASSQEIVPTFITDDIAYASDSCEYRFARGAWGDHGQLTSGSAFDCHCWLARRSLRPSAWPPLPTSETASPLVSTISPGSTSTPT